MIDKLPDLVHRITSAITDSALLTRRREASGKLEKKWIEKWDKDLQTIASLHAYAQSTGRVLALQGGIAVEAHCGGVLTRPHDDVDAVMYMNPDRPINHDQDRTEIETLLQEESGTKWVLHNEEGTHKLDFREDVRAKPWGERRRVEVNWADYPVGERTQTMDLKDSKGRSRTVTVEHIDLLVANKARIIVNNVGKSDIPRRTRHQDLDDMRRLMAQSHYNRDHCLTFLQSYYIYRENLNPARASSKASEVLQKAESMKFLRTG